MSLSLWGRVLGALGGMVLLFGIFMLNRPSDYQDESQNDPLAGFEEPGRGSIGMTLLFAGGGLVAVAALCLIPSVVSKRPLAPPLHEDVALPVAVVVSLDQKNPADDGASTRAR